MSLFLSAVVGAWVLAPAPRQPRHISPRANPLRVQDRQLTDEALACISDLVGADSRVVLQTVLQDPWRALELAREAAARRVPLMSWTLQYQADQCQIGLLDLMSNSTLLRDHDRSSYNDLGWRRAQLEEQLANQRTRIRSALLALRPALRTRLLAAARERPALVPAASRSLLQSGMYKALWHGNLAARRLRAPAQFEATRARLVEDWLALLIDAHRKLDDEEDAQLAAFSLAAAAADALRQAQASTEEAVASWNWAPQALWRDWGRDWDWRPSEWRPVARGSLGDLKRGSIPVQATEAEPGEERTPRDLLQGLVLSWGLDSPLSRRFRRGRARLSYALAELAAKIAYAWAPWRRPAVVIHFCSALAQRCGWKARGALRRLTTSLRAFGGPAVAGTKTGADA